MKKSSFFIMFSMTLAGSVNAGGYIDDGLLAKKKAFPSVVKVMTYDFSTFLEIPESSCTGTLIAPNVVLTAAHCIENDNKKRMRVSLAGDEEGLTDEVVTGSKSKGGIRVIKSYVPKNFEFYKQKVKELSSIMNSPLFESLSQEIRDEVLLEYIKGRELRTAYDLAIVELKTDQKISKRLIPKVGCERLPDETNVMLAGYGVKISAETNEDLNSHNVLYYGYNKISSSIFKNLNYILEASTGQMMANWGDSGGPLFIKDNQKKVYGVVSRKVSGESKRSTLNSYSSTSSVVAKDFFRSLVNDASVSESIKKVIKDCAE